MPDPKLPAECKGCPFRIKNIKSVRTQENPEASNVKTPSWCFSRMDNAHPRWNPYRMSHRRLTEILRDFEGLTWQEILCAPKSHGTGSKSHPVSVDRLSRAAKARLLEIGKDDLDELFSLRLDGKKRIYGIREERCLHLLWYDANHEVYELDRD